MIVIAAACGGDKKPKNKPSEDAGARADALRVSGEAERDKLFLSVPTAKAVEGVIERLSAKPHIAGTKANEAVAKEIMRTLGRMGWKLGTQTYDVYLPHPKKLSLKADGVDLAVTEPAAAKYGDETVFQTWNAYSASGRVKAALVEDVAAAKSKILLVPYGPLYRGAQVASTSRRRIRRSHSSPPSRASWACARSGSRMPSTCRSTTARLRTGSRRRSTSCSGKTEARRGARQAPRGRAPREVAADEGRRQSGEV